MPNLFSDKGSRKKRVQKRYLKKIKIETVNAMLSSASEGEICESSNPQASTTNKKQSTAAVIAAVTPTASPSKLPTRKKEPSPRPRDSSPADEDDDDEDDDEEDESQSSYNNSSSESFAFPKRSRATT